jgi:PKD repeat protein
MKRLKFRLFNKGIRWRFACLTLILLSLLGKTDLLGQIPLAGDPRDCDYSCASSDFVIEEVYLTNPGIEDCELGMMETSDLCIVIYNNTNSAGSVLIAADLYIDGMFSSEILYCLGSVDGKDTDTICLVNYINWTCGQAVELTNVWLGWTAANGDCPGPNPTCTGQNAYIPSGKCRYYANLVINTPLIPNFSFIAECIDQAFSTVTFTDETTGGVTPYFYSWDFGDGTSSTDMNPVHTYSSAGTFTVTLEVTDSDDPAKVKSIMKDVEVIACCMLEVTCPPTMNLGSFACGTMPDCAQTEAEFEALGGIIGNMPCGDIVILCNDSPDPALRYCTNQQIVRTYIIFDDLDSNGMLDMDERSDTCTQTYTILPPALSVISCPSLPDITCEQVAGYTPPSASYSNGLTGNCLLSGTVTGSVTSSDYDSCGGYLIVTYSGQDDCGRNLVAVQCTVTVTAAALPVISCPSLPDITCEQVAGYTPPSASYSNGLTGVCLISGTVTGSVTSSDYDSCGGYLIVTYSGQDDCGRNLVAVQCTVNVTAAALPVINCPSLPDITCEQVAGYTPPSASYSNGLTGVCLISGTVTGSVTSSDYDSCGGYLIVTYSGQDDCGRNLVAVQCTVNVTAAALPVISCPSLPDITCEQVAGYTPPSASYSNGLTGVCLISGTVTGSVTSSDYDSCGGYLIVTYSGQDDCSRDLVAVQCTVNVTAAALPVIVCPSLPDITCEQVAGYTPPSASYSNGLTGVCLISGTVTGSVTSSDYDSCGGYLIVTYSGQDDCGRNLVAVQCTVNVTAAALPVISCPSLPNITCEQVAGYTPPSASYSNGLTGVCLISGTVTGSVTSSDYDSCGGYLIVTYSGQDDCGRNLVAVQCTVNVTAAALPVISCPSLPDITCEQVAAYTPPSASYSNGLTGVCLISGTVTGSVTSSDYDSCGGYLIVTYSGQDDCGRNLVAVQCTVNVTAAALPVISCPSLPDITCEQVAAYTPPSASYSNGLTGVCALSGTVSGLVTSSIYDACGGVLFVTYSGKDDCGRDLVAVQCTVRVTEAALPVISCPSLPDITCEQVAGYTPPSASYSNNLGGDCELSGTVNGLVTSSNYNACGGYLIVTYSGQDDCGRNLAEVQCTVMVTAAPVPEFTCPTGSDITCFEDLEDAILIDSATLASSIIVSCDLEVDITVTRPVYTDNCNDTEYQVIFEISDECDRPSQQCTVIYTIDHLPPSVSCPGNMTLDQCTPFSEIESDWDAWIDQFEGFEGDCNGSLEIYVNGILSLEYPSYTDLDPCGDTINIELVAANDCASEEARCSSTFIISPAPDLALSCPTNPTIVEEDNQTAVDEAFEDWKEFFEFYGGCNGVKKFYINDIEIDLDTLSAPSHCGGEVTVKMVVTSDCARDSCESEFITVATAQAIIVALPGMLTECFTEENPPTADDVPLRTLENVLAAYATMTDCVDPNEIEMITMVSGPMINGNEYTFIRTYFLSAPNAVAEPADESITFFWDPNAPTLSGLPEDLALPCGSELPEWPVVSAYDVEFGEVTVIASSSQVGTSCGGKVQRTWTAYDGCGNSVTGVQTITFYDNEPPVLIVPADTVIHCGNAIPEPVYQASDNCSAFFVEYQEKITTHNECEYTITRIWIARDACYNFSRDTQIIDIIDTVPPVIEVINPMIAGIPNGGEMSIFGCIMDPAFLMTDVDVYDECCTATYSTSDRLIASGVCDIFGYYRKWKCTAIATDPAGNVSEFYFYVLQYDTSAPVIYNVPADLDLECGAEIPAPDTTVYVEDDCSLVSSPLFSEEVITDPEDSSKVLYIRTWWAEDYCGNRAEATQIIRVCAFDTVMASSAIGNTVWEDLNANGMQDPGEPGINGIKVYLYQSDPAAFNTMKVVASTVTATIEGQKGQFCFDHLPADRYQLQFEIPASMQFTTMKAGQDDELDSDVDPATGMTALINLHQQQRMNNIDAGLITRQSNTLFVELADFSVRSESCSHTISWITSSETDLLASFVIEYSADGNSFSEVQKVAPRGDFDKRTNYSFTDPVKRSKGHYRLTMIDVSGSEIHSDWKRVSGRCIDDRNFTVFPNPFREIFQIEFTSPRTGDAEILIFDRLGKLIQNTSVQTNQGFNREDVDLKQLPVGTYMVQIRMDDWTDHKLIIKTR